MLSYSIREPNFPYDVCKPAFEIIILKRGLFWLRVLEFSVHGQFAFLPLGLWQDCTLWREHMMEEKPHLMANAGK
jgi:hypothetical protein